MKNSSRTILHVDMDAFFASVEQLDNPALRGKPVLVGYDGARGVVAAASYESRVFGCRSAQPIAVAKRLCPQAIIVPVRHGRYREESRKVFAIFERYTPVIEPLSIDEAFLDVTGSERLHGSGEAIAARIKQQVHDETGLTASVGVAPNKFLAKLASDLNKPNGLTIVRDGQVDALLEPMSVSRIWGVGPKMAGMLAGLGITTIGQLRKMPIDVLARRVGREEAEHFQRLAHGIDSREVTPDREAKSIGQEQTFGVDVADVEAVRGVLLEQAEQVAARIRRHELRARSVTVKIRFGDFQTITRRCTLPQASDSTAEIWKAAREQFERWAVGEFKPVRLIGVSAGSFDAADAQLDLFANPQSQKQKELDRAVDRINAKFGGTTIRRGKPGRDSR
jgi:DNA polymerase-4